MIGWDGFDDVGLGVCESDVALGVMFLLRCAFCVRLARYKSR